MASISVCQLQSILLDFPYQVEVFEHETFQLNWGYRSIGRPSAPAGPPGIASTGTQLAETHAEDTTQDMIPGSA